MIIASHFFAVGVASILFGIVAYKVCAVSEGAIPIDLVTLFLELIYLAWLFTYIRNKLRVRGKRWSLLGFTVVRPGIYIKYIARFYLIMALLLLSLIVVVALISNIATSDAPTNIPPKEQLQIWSIPSAVIVAPFIEELIFRSILFPALLTRYRRWHAIIIDGFIFALCHVDPMAIVGALPLGLYSAWLYNRTGSIWPSIVLHMSWNLFVTIIKM